MTGWGNILLEAPAGFMVSHPSRQNTYRAQSLDSRTAPPTSPRLPDMNTFHPLVPSRLPANLSYIPTEEDLQEIARNQQILVTTMWEAFQSLGYRIDKQQIDLGKINDRLWKLEHPKAETGICVS